MPTQKTPEEAARLSEARAEKARKQHAQKQESRPVSFTPKELLNALRDNEQGDAALIIKALKGRFIFDKQEDRAYLFDRLWMPDKLEIHFQEARHILTQAYGNEATRQWKLANDPRAAKDDKDIADRRYRDFKKRINQLNTLSRLKRVLAISAKGANSLALGGDEWDQLENRLQTQNQIIDLRTGQARDGRPEDYMRTACPVPWQGPHIECPTWAAAFSNMFETEDTAHYMHKVLGASLLSTRLQEFFILCGEGANGKSTLLETVKLILGPMAGTVRNEMLLGYRPQSSGADPELLDLRGKRIVWTSETGKRQKLNIEKIKNFTGSDTLSGRLNYQNEIIEFKPNFTTFILTNHTPIIENTDYGTWRRIRLIPFPFRFVSAPSADNEKPKIPDLEERLQNELPGILAWLVRGCTLYQEEGLEAPRNVLDSTHDYRRQEDIIGQFIEARCERHGKVQAGPLKDEFAEWYKEEFGQSAKVPGGKAFKREMLNHCGYDNTGRYNYYTGISIKSSS